jgi:hypothetical protein
MNDGRLNAAQAPRVGSARRQSMTDHKKKGDFDQWQRDDEGGNKKAHKHAQNSRTSDKQNAGSGSRH